MNLQEIIDKPLNILLATIIVDVIALILTRNNLVGEVIKEWYDRFSLSAFVADISSIMFGIFLALYLFKYVFPQKWFNLWTFLLTVVIIQLIHDLTFAYFLNNIKESKNSMINLFKNYIDENSWMILLVDALMMIGTVLITYMLYKVDNVIIYTLLAFMLYFSQFLIAKS